jgi:hypothetical protein
MGMHSVDRSRFEADSLKFAAIDIGSNAVRLLLSRVYEHFLTPTFIK